jgi:hypothetical protein
VTSNFLVGQQDKLAVAYGDIALGLIQVYKALGGGWEIRCAPPEFLQLTPGEAIPVLPAQPGRPAPEPAPLPKGSAKLLPPQLTAPGSLPIP